MNSGVDDRSPRVPKLHLSSLLNDTPDQAIEKLEHQIDEAELTLECELMELEGLERDQDAHESQLKQLNDLLDMTKQQLKDTESNGKIQSQRNLILVLEYTFE